MPNRIIKDSIHHSEKVKQMTDFQFRVWINLITYVDDYGRGDARPAIIKGTCFPLRQRLTIKDITVALKQLASIGCIALYQVDGRPYLYFPNWGLHQNIRNKRSRYPAPPDLQTLESNCNQLNANVPVIQSESESESNPNREPESEPRRGGAQRGHRAPVPELEEIMAYCQERHSSVDPEQFFDFYTANGWTQGRGKPIQDWKAALRTWERRDRETSAGAQGSGVSHAVRTEAEYAQGENFLDKYKALKGEQT